MPDLDRGKAKDLLLPALHDLDIRINGITADSCQCGLVAEVALDALWPTPPEQRPVFCPFASDHVCPSDCPSNRDRACVNGE